jgi:glycine oxidase
MSEARASDVLVVGAGVIGCAAAIALARRGLSVTLLERGDAAIGRGPEGSSAAAGILGAQLEGIHGDGPLARLCLQSRDLYPAFVREVEEASGLDVEMRPCGVLRVAFDAAGVQALVAEILWQEQAGMRVERLDAAAVRAIEPALAGVCGGVRFPDDPRIDPPALLAALRLAAERSGVALRRGASVDRVIVASGRAAGVRLADGNAIAAGAVVLSAGSWSSLIGNTSLAPDAVEPARGQMIELRVDEPVIRGVVEGLDCYLSPRDDGRLLVGSTVERVGFRPGATAGAVRDLLSAAIHLAPALESATLTRAWAGFRPRTRDELPLLGTVGIDRFVVATGHFRNGVLLAPITGQIVAALLTGSEEPADLSPFDPRR